MSRLPELSQQSVTSEASKGDGDPTTWAVARRVFTWLYALALAAATAGLVVIWKAWEPEMGQSVQILASYAVILLLLVLTAGWLLMFSPFRWQTVVGLFVLIALTATGAFAAVRNVEFDGNMGLVVHYRWEPTAAERLAAHRRALAESVGPMEPFDVPPITPEDMPAYRGLHRDGLVFGPQLAQDWQTSPPRELWKQPCGGGYSSFAVVGDVAVTLEQRGDKESVVCYDVKTGAERWVYEYPASFQEAMGGPGPRATPTISDGDVYSYGAEGNLVCLALGTGQPRWQVDVLPDGAKNAEWGMASSPLIVDNLVIVEAGGPAGDGLVALDRTSGEVVWERPGIAELKKPDVKNYAGYSSPVLETIAGVRQVLIFDGKGLRSHVPETGEQLWFHEFSNGPGVNVAQPVLLEGDRMFLSQSYGVGCRLIAVTHDADSWQTRTLWDNMNMRCKFTSPVLHEGYLYGLDEGILVCLDPETGDRQWKKGRYGHGQILLTNGQLVVISEKGVLALVAADPDACHEITRFPALDSPKVWNPHALAHGIVYIRNHETMAAYDLRAD